MCAPRNAHYRQRAHAFCVPPAATLPVLVQHPNRSIPPRTTLVYTYVCRCMYLHLEHQSLRALAKGELADRDAVGEGRDEVLHIDPRVGSLDAVEGLRPVLPPAHTLGVDGPPIHVLAVGALLLRLLDWRQASTAPASARRSPRGGCGHGRRQVGFRGGEGGDGTGKGGLQAGPGQLGAEKLAPRAGGFRRFRHGLEDGEVLVFFGEAQGDHAEAVVERARQQTDPVGSDAR